MITYYLRSDYLFPVIDTSRFVKQKFPLHSFYGSFEKHPFSPCLPHTTQKITLISSSASSTKKPRTRLCYVKLILQITLNSLEPFLELPFSFSPFFPLSALSLLPHSPMRFSNLSPTS